MICVDPFSGWVVSSGLKCASFFQFPPSTSSQATIAKTFWDVIGSGIAFSRAVAKSVGVPMQVGFVEACAAVVAAGTVAAPIAAAVITAAAIRCGV